MIDLIPLIPSSLLESRKKKLKVFLLLARITNEAIEALTCYLNKNYAAFDAQVGDAACQIRAYKICLLAMDAQFYGMVKCKIEKLVNYKLAVRDYLTVYMKKLKLAPTYLKDLDRKETLLDFFARYSLEFFLSDDFKFVILAFFLKKYCLVEAGDIPGSIDYKMIQASWNLGSTPARNIANHYQSMLSKLSCGFLFDLSGDHLKNNAKLFRSLLRMGDRKRFFLPYFDGIKTLIHGLLTSKLPVIFSITRTSKNRREKHVFLFKKEESSGKFLFQFNPAQYARDTPCVVFRGRVDYQDKVFEPIESYLKRWFRYSVESIILMNAASHPQYTGKNLEAYRTEPYKDMMEKDATNPYLQVQAQEMDVELKYYQHLASILGCSQKHQGLFYIEHIFCDLIKNEAEKTTQLPSRMSLTSSEAFNLPLLNLAMQTASTTWKQKVVL